jgi:RNA polymerase sigma-70 factor, ECF subfamily
MVYSPKAKASETSSLVFPQKSTEELIQDLRQASDLENDFRILFERYYARVYRFFERKGFPPEDCADLSQEVFFSVYTGVKDLRDEAAFQSWMFTLARNTFLNEVERKRAKKRDGIELSIEVEVADNPALSLADSLPGNPKEIPIQIVLEREKLQKVRQAVEELPPQMRRCVHLRVLKDCSYEEIAVIMGRSINTVKAHLFKAREALKEKLGPYCD